MKQFHISGDSTPLKAIRILDEEDAIDLMTAVMFTYENEEELTAKIRALQIGEYLASRFTIIRLKDKSTVNHMGAPFDEDLSRER